MKGRWQKEGKERTKKGAEVTGEGGRKETGREEREGRREGIAVCWRKD